MTLALDHLVVAAGSLAEGAAWCKAVLGATPEPGGKHPAMGTHNLLLAIGSPRFAKAYLEIIAIDPEAPAPAGPRWFDLDRMALSDALAAGPRLVHWVANSTDIQADRDAILMAGHDPGVITRAERMTARGLLTWHITLRADGGRPADGAIPLLIQWGGVHPSDSLPPSGVRLEAVRLGEAAAGLAAGFGVSVNGDASVPLSVTLASPRGPVDLAVVAAA